MESRMTREMIEMRVKAVGIGERIRLDPEFREQVVNDPRAGLQAAGMTPEEVTLLHGDTELMSHPEASGICCNTGCCGSITIVC